MDFLFAATTTAAESPNLFQALGIDAKLLIQQAVSFLILVAILAKFVYPVLIKAIDDRRAAIETSLEEAKESHQLLEKTEGKVAKLLAEARKEADEIIARSHQESIAQVAEAEDKAKARAAQIVKDAHTQLEADVVKARQALKRDTAHLVALATERIIHEKVDARKDAELIDRALSKETA